MINWIDVEDDLPVLGDYCVLGYFIETDSIETIHVEDYFKDITSGIDENGTQLYIKWYKNKISHWMYLPEAPQLNKSVNKYKICGFCKCEYLEKNCPVCGYEEE